MKKSIIVLSILVSCLVMLGMGSASTATGNSNIKATISSSGTITGSNIASWTLGLGSNSATNTITVSTNSGSWSVKAAPTSATDGKLAISGTNPVVKLGSPLFVNDASNTPTSLATSGGVTVLTGSASANQNYNIGLSQQVVIADQPGTYSIDMTYTLTY